MFFLGGSNWDFLVELGKNILFGIGNGADLSAPKSGDREPWTVSGVILCLQLLSKVQTCTLHLS